MHALQTRAVRTALTDKGEVRGWFLTRFACSVWIATVSFWCAIYTANVHDPTNDEALLWGNPYDIVVFSVHCLAWVRFVVTRNASEQHSLCTVNARSLPCRHLISFPG